MVGPNAARFLYHQQRHSGAGRNRSSTTPLKERVIQIMPILVHLLNQPYLPCPVPSLDGLLPGNGTQHRLMHLIPHQSVDAIPSGKSRGQIILVLPDALHQVGGHPQVEGASGPTGQQVDTGLFLLEGHGLNPFSFHSVEVAPDWVRGFPWIPAYAGMTGWAGSSPTRPLNSEHLRRVH